MSLSAELEWAQFLVIMVVGFMLLYDCVLNRKHVRKMEGLLVDGKDAYYLEGMQQMKSDLGRGAFVQTPGRIGNCRSDQGSGNPCPNTIGMEEGMLGGAEVPVYYPTLSAGRAQYVRDAAEQARERRLNELTHRTAKAQAAYSAQQAELASEGMDNIEKNLGNMLHQ